MMGQRISLRRVFPAVMLLAASAFSVPAQSAAEEKARRVSVSYTDIPTTISVALTGFHEGKKWKQQGSPIKKVVEVPFQLYIKDVIGFEWRLSEYQEFKHDDEHTPGAMDHQKAAAMAAKMVTLWKMNLPPNAPLSQHWRHKDHPQVLDNDYDHVYIPHTCRETEDGPKTDECKGLTSYRIPKDFRDKAVDATWTTLLKRTDCSKDYPANSNPFEVHYNRTPEGCQLSYTQDHKEAYGYMCMPQVASREETKYFTLPQEALRDLVREGFPESSKKTLESAQRFQLTGYSLHEFRKELQQLKKKSDPTIDVRIIDMLQPLSYQIFTHEQDFLAAVEHAIGDEQATRHNTRILKYGQKRFADVLFPDERGLVTMLEDLLGAETLALHRELLVKYARPRDWLGLLDRYYDTRDVLPPVVYPQQSLEKGSTVEALSTCLWIAFTKDGPSKFRCGTAKKDPERIVKMRFRATDDRDRIECNMQNEDDGCPFGDHYVDIGTKGLVLDVQENTVKMDGQDGKSWTVKETWLNVQWKVKPGSDLSDKMTESERTIVGWSRDTNIRPSDEEGSLVEVHIIGARLASKG